MSPKERAEIFAAANPGLAHIRPPIALRVQALLEAAEQDAVAAERERCLSHLLDAIADWLAAPVLLTLRDVRLLMGRAEARIRDGSPRTST